MGFSPSFSCFAMGQNEVCLFSYSFLYFWPTFGIFPYMSCKISEFTKTPIYMVFGEFYTNVGGVRYELRTANICSKKYNVFRKKTHLHLQSKIAQHYII
jgi:hypothetical protein